MAGHLVPNLGRAPRRVPRRLGIKGGARLRPPRRRQRRPSVAPHLGPPPAWRPAAALLLGAPAPARPVRRQLQCNKRAMSRPSTSKACCVEWSGGPPAQISPPVRSAWKESRSPSASSSVERLYHCWLCSVAPSPSAAGDSWAATRAAASLHASATTCPSRSQSTRVVDAAPAAIVAQRLAPPRARFRERRPAQPPPGA